MDIDWLYFFSETIPNWLMAISALSAAVVFVWRKQDKQEKEIEKRDEVFNGINAVWVKALVGESAQPKWGLLVQNNLKAPVTNIRIACRGNRHSSDLRHPNVQHGEHFFESLAQPDKGNAWALPTSKIREHEFITSSSKYGTTTVEFTFGGKVYTKDIEKSNRMVPGWLKEF